MMKFKLFFAATLTSAALVISVPVAAQSVDDQIAGVARLCLATPLQCADAISDFNIALTGPAPRRVLSVEQLALVRNAVVNASAESPASRLLLADAYEGTVARTINPPPVAQIDIAQLRAGFAIIAADFDDGPVVVSPI